MKVLFDFFEGISAPIYFAEYESENLVFINECLRRRLGFLREEDYVGKNRRDVLKGCGIKFCFLENEKEEAETYFVTKEKIFEHEGKKYRIEAAFNSSAHNIFHTDDEDKLHQYLSQNYYDIGVLFTAISQDNGSSYFFMGDMQTGVFWISDNMRDDFNFQDNVVPDFLVSWADRIETENSRKLYLNDIKGIEEEKRTVHDLRYQIQDVNGNSMWIRCYATVKWNEDKTKMLFCAGRISHQDKNFVVDVVTNFPGSHTAELSLSEIRRQGEKVLVIGFGLNNITELNNSRGRRFSDNLLKQIASSLNETLSQRMSFFRLDGMKFIAIVSPWGKDDDRSLLVDSIRYTVEAHYAMENISASNACSFGLIEYPCDDLEPEDLIENITSLIRIARKNPDQLFADYSTNSIKQIKEEAGISLELRKNVIDGMRNFRAMIQPVVSTADSRVIGGETLMRWKFEGKDISPETFIAILERDNMIHIAGRWIFEQTVIACKKIIEYSPTFYLTFNVSLNQLSDKYFLSFMEDTLKKHELDGKHLVVELTESCLDEHPERLDRFVEKCKSLGMRIALDDFGSGYSSMRMLLQYPASIIKLDRSLLTEMTESEEKKNFILSIVYACHRFGKDVCMEGVETQFQDEIIKASGCDIIQGYYYFRPMEIQDVFDLMKNRKEA